MWGLDTVELVIRKDRRCRAGSLRVERSLRDAYTDFAVGLPLVGARMFQATNESRDTKGIYASRIDRPYQGPHKQVFVCGVAERNGPGRQAIVYPPKNRRFESVDTA